MNNGWREISPDAISLNPFKLIGTDWMLITAGSIDSWNTMTASWGGLGFLWGKNVCFCFVRPTRYTFEFMERSMEFTLSFFPAEYRKALSYCGAHSGKEVDKAAETGLIPKSVGAGLSFEQANLAILCRKLYHHDFDPAKFIDTSIEANYPAKDYHRQYIGEILSCYTE